MDPSLITKYFSGRCSDKELEEILDWFQTQKGQAFLRKQIRKDCQRLIENKSAFRCRNIDTKKVFKRILKSIGADIPLARKKEAPRRNKHLAFDNEPLRIVSRQLESFYDVDIEFQSEQLKKLNLTADFNHKNVEMVLQSISNLLDINYKRAGNSKFVWLKPPETSRKVQ